MPYVPHTSEQPQVEATADAAPSPAAVRAMISIAGLERAFSKERLAGYRHSADVDHTDGLARYLWNLALAEGIGPDLHTLEVTVRNEIIRASNKIVPARINLENAAALAAAGAPAFTAGAFATWLDISPTMLMRNEREKLDRAKSELGSHLGSHTEGHLVAKLDFGFWVALCRQSYVDTRADGPRLWPAGLKHGFRNRPSSIATISQIFHRLDAIRTFRNRVAHHEPIWDRDYLVAHDAIIDTLSWMSPKLAATMRTLARAPSVYAAGASAYRPLAEDILGTGPGRSADPVNRVVTAIRGVPEATRSLAASTMIAALQIPELDVAESSEAV